MPFQVKTPYDVAKQIIQLRQDGFSVADICSQLSIGKSTIYRIFAEQEQKLTRPHHWLNLEGRAEEICSLYRLGLSVRSICDALGIARGNAKTIATLLRSKNVQIRPSATPKFLDLVESVVNLYLSGKGSTSIARDIGISKSSVRKLLMLAQVDIRPKRKPAIRGKRERDKLIASEFDYLNRIAISQLKSFDYRSLGISLDDAKQTAMMAAIRAAELWEGKNGGSFRTYAGVWIKFAILGLIKEQIKHRHSSIDKVSEVKINSVN